MAAFAAVGILVYRYLPFRGVSNIWFGDGLIQHFPALMYYNEVVRGWLANPGAGLPQWSWRIGMGADVLSTLSYYFADPFAVLSLLFPADSMELAYELLFYLRLACAGAAGYWFMREMKAERFAATVGAITYVFATFAMFSALRHPYFVNAMIWLPLMLIGVERDLRRRSPLLLIAVVGISAASNYYFFYQLAVMLVVYAVARWVELTPAEERRSAFWRDAGRLAGHVIIGVLLACVVLVPSAMGVLASSRASVGSLGGLFHPLRDYGTFLAAITSTYVPVSSAFMGFAAVGVLLVPVVLMRRRSIPFAVRLMLVAFPVALIFPWLGSFMNALTFPSYRFLFGWGLFLAVGTAFVLTDPKPLTRRELGWSLGLFGVYSAGVVAISMVSGGYAAQAGQRSRMPQGEQMLFPLAIGALTWAVLAAYSWYSAREASAGREPGARYQGVAVAAILALAVANIAGNAAYLYRRDGADVLAEYVKRGQSAAAYAENAGSLARELPGDGFFRVDKQSHVWGRSSRPVASNDALAQRYDGLTFYYSIMSEQLGELMREIDNRSVWLSFGYSGFDDRAALLTLAGVRYYIAEPTGTAFVPYGFDLMSREGNATIYRNRYALPLGFVYDSVIERDRYERLSSLEKQQALLQAAVVDAAPPGIPELEPALDVVESTTTVTANEARLGPGAITTLKREGGVTVSATPVPDSETYLEITGVDYWRTLPKSSGLLPAPLRRLLAIERPSNLDILTVTDTGAEKLTRWLTPEATYFAGDRSLLINMGYSPQGVKSVQVKIRGVGTLDYDSLKLYSVPAGSYARDAAALARTPLRDVEARDGSVRGTVTAEKPGVLYLSVPYSSGWTATVDGEPATLLRTNTAFSGLAIEPGEHTIELTYRTPGLTAGLLASALGALALAFVLVRGRRERAS